MKARMRYMAMVAMVAVVGSVTVPAVAATDKPGETQMCVPLINIDQTPVIDDSTILLKMRAKNSYKRIDLVSPCPGLKIQNGFSHSTSTQDMCIQDPLRVLEPVGAVCMMKQIVNITPEEAKQLLAKR